MRVVPTNCGLPLCVSVDNHLYSMVCVRKKMLHFLKVIVYSV